MFLHKQNIVAVYSMIYGPFFTWRKTECSVETLICDGMHLCVAIFSSIVCCIAKVIIFSLLFVWLRSTKTSVVGSKCKYVLKLLQ